MALDEKDMRTSTGARQITKSSGTDSAPRIAMDPNPQSIEFARDNLSPMPPSSNHPVSRLFTLISRIPGLEEYFSHNIYCILEKP